MGIAVGSLIILFFDGLVSEYSKQGASIVDKAKVFESDIILKFNPPNAEEANLFKDGATLFSLLFPEQNGHLVIVFCCIHPANYFYYFEKQLYISRNLFESFDNPYVEKKFKISPEFWMNEEALKRSTLPLILNDFRRIYKHSTLPSSIWKTCTKLLNLYFKR